MKPPKIVQLSKEAREWVSMYIARKEQSAEKEGLALFSLIESLNNTVRYIANVNSSTAVESEEKNMELSNQWSKTSILVRPFKPSLSSKCFFKGLYWADQGRFSDEEIDSLGISIEEMQKEIDAAIKST